MKLFIHKYALPLCLSSLVGRNGVEGAGEGTFFSYFHIGGLGPDRWPLLQDPANQCGGTNFQSGYGQSPVAIPYLKDKCDTGMDQNYQFNAGNCAFSQLDFTISNNGVKVAPKSDVSGDPKCDFGSMKIPHLTNLFKAAQFHIHTKTEHTIDNANGIPEPDLVDKDIRTAELHAVHVADDEKSYAVFGTMIEINKEDPNQSHEIMEEYLRGWEKTAQAVENACKATARKLADDKVFQTVQDAVQCDAVGEMNFFPQDFTDANRQPDIYSELNDPQGVYTYKGGLTTPPCSELVNWNLLDSSMLISENQMDRLYKLILCFVDGCIRSSVASEIGSTSRPPQPLDRRQVIHRCKDTNPKCGETCQQNKIVDQGSTPPQAKDIFKKPADVAEPDNAEDARCEQAIYEDCPDDPKVNPGMSPNLKARADVWKNFQGYWVGEYTAQDREGNPQTETFASPSLKADVPYPRSGVKIFVNRTIRETRYYESTYYVHPPASDLFCSLPIPTDATNVLEGGKCGKNGFVRHSERFGTATHEKDGTIKIIYGNGIYKDAPKGTGIPVSDNTVYFKVFGDKEEYTETYSFTNDDKTLQGGTGQQYLHYDFLPYSRDPHESTFTYFLSEVNRDDFIVAINKAYTAYEVPDGVQIPSPQMTACLDMANCPSNELWNQNDVLTTETPYDTDTSVKAGFIAGMVILGLLVVLGIAFFLHRREAKKQRERIQHQFARRVAETINVEGSHEMLSPEALEDEFKRIDVDHDGTLSKSELKQFVDSGKVGIMSDSDFNALFSALDVDGSGEVDFTEFCAFMVQCGQAYDEEEMKLAPEDRRKSIAKIATKRWGQPVEKTATEGNSDEGTGNGADTGVPL